MVKEECAMTDQELIAQFVASRGVTRVEAGVRTITEREFYQTRRNDRKVVSDEQRLINERHEVVDHRGVTRVRNGLGEWIS
jgi:hypothetical protein